MRRTRFVILAGLTLQLVWPSSADAWWGWIDELTGPKGFHGLQMDARIKCFGAPRNELEEALLEVVRTERRLEDAAKALRRAGTYDGGERPDALDKLLTFTSDRAHVAGQLVGTYVLRTAVDPAFGEAAVDELSTLVAALQPALARSSFSSFLVEFSTAFKVPGGLVKEGFVGTALIPGVRLSLCREKEDAERRFAIGLGSRLFWSTDSSPELEGASEAYANGHRMYLFTAIASVEYRPLYFRERFCDGRDCQEFEWLDWVDVQAGAGYYRVTSEGFKLLHGKIVEAAATIHLPSSLRNSHRWAFVVPQFRIGKIGFVDGFQANAFGPNLKGEKARPKHAGGVDWTTQYAWYIDLGPLFK